MRKIRYQVACSLDGYIAGPNGEYDWIVTDPDIDFKALYEQFDTVLMGRRTYEAAGGNVSPGMRTLVFSRTLDGSRHAGVDVVSEGAKEILDDLREQPGKDIWLFGGGDLFGSLLEIGCVDTVELAVEPVLLGGGLSFLPSPAVRRRLHLSGTRVYEKSGIVLLKYDVVPEGTARGTHGKRRRG